MMNSFRITLVAALVALAAACSQEAPETPAAAAPSAAADAAPEPLPPVTVDMPTPPGEPPVGVPPAADDTCGAAKYAGLVGRPVDMPGVPEPGPDFRHITPDTHVTMDFREDRINMDITAEGVITGFRCG